MPNAAQIPNSPITVQSSQEGGSRAGGIKVRLTLGPALIDLEATLEEIVVVVTRLTQEFAKASIITTSGIGEPLPAAATGTAASAA